MRVLDYVFLISSLSPLKVLLCRNLFTWSNFASMSACWSFEGIKWNITVPSSAFFQV